ncbi:hypothetical protein EWH99_11610 [Sporolactobacillus sp. THM7-7]|nr:hypothetical protein EWH99_11610 [Sporolactobacillus sp. THM7-7]
MKKNLGAVGLVAGVAGFAAGLAVRGLVSGRLLGAEKVLRIVRRTAGKTLPVDGAWIYLSPQNVTRDALSLQIYRGGLTAAGARSVRHFDFMADARTGTLIELKEQH